MYKYGPLKKALYPTFDEARKAIEKADTEETDKRDPRDLASILMRMVEASPRLRGHILTRRTAVSSFGWQFTADEDADLEKMKEAEMRMTRTIRRMLRWHTDVPAYGAQILEILWIDVNGFKVSTIAKRFSPVEIDRPSSNADDLAILEDVIGANGKPTGKFTRLYLKDLPKQSYLYDVDESYETGGVLRALIPHEITRHDMMMEWSAFNKKVKGIILAQYGEHAQDEDKAMALETMKNVTKHNYTLTSKDLEFLFKNTVDSVGATSFKQQIEKIEADEAIAILGQANTTELPDSGGSRAALDVLNLIRADIHFADINRIEEQINDQLVLYDYQLNVDATALEAPWRFRVKLSEDQDIEKNANVIDTLLGAGIPLKTDEIYERCGFTRPDDNDAVVAGKGGTAGTGGMLP